MNTKNQYNPLSFQPSSSPKVEWRLVTSWTPSLDVLHSSVINIAERVAAATDGNFRISVFSADEVVPALKVFDAVRDGTVECGHTTPIYYTEHNESFGIVAGLPFGFTSQQQNAWLYYGGGLEATKTVYADLYYYPGWWEPGSILNFVINTQAWDTIPQRYQHIIETACAKAQVSTLSHYETLNQSALARLVAGGTELRPFSEPIMLAAKKTAFELYEDIAQNNPMFRDIFEDWKEFRKHIYNWNRFNELEFARFVTDM